MKKCYYTGILLFVLFLSLPSDAQVVINEIYGGGGNSGSTYRNDFIELYNNGNTAVDLTGWSVQYASSTSSSWQKTDLSGIIPPNGHFLIQEAQGAGGTTDLPAPDATGTINLAGTSGKIALVNNVTLLTGTCPTGASIVDFAGYGTANCFEGVGAAPAPSNTTSIQRTAQGTDTGNNNTDFTTGTLSPMNTGISAGSLPVVLTEFIIRENAGTVTASWITEQENNSKEFELERAVTGNSFISIGKVPAAGYSQNPTPYQITDYRPVTGTILYRLKQIDLDGSFTYSPVIKIDFRKTSSLEIKPNPAREKFVITTGNREGSAILQLIDMTGRLVKTEILSSGVVSHEISLTGIRKGVYLLRLLLNNTQETLKLVVE